MTKRKKIANGNKEYEKSNQTQQKGDILAFKKLLEKFQLTEKQKKLLEAIENNEIIIITGPAGTSKTFMECYYAIKAYSEHKFDKILCIKPIFEAGEKLGALPGDVSEKIDPYYESYKQNFNKLIGKDEIKKLLDKEIIDFRPISYLRGTGWDNCLMVADEAQNFDAKTLVLFITRMGNNSKVIVSGDINQSDIKSENVALPWLADLISKVNGVFVFKFDENDTMRNKILIEITKLYENAKIKGDIPKNKYI